MKKIMLQTRTKFDFIRDFTLAKLREKEVRGFLNRTAVLLMVTALLLPLMVFQPLMKVSAKSDKSFASSAAPYSAPPVPFIFSSPDNGNNFVPAYFLSTVSSGYSSVAGLFSAPQLPEGFAAAQPVSPASSFFGKLFGFFASSTAVEYIPPSSGSVEFDYDGDGKADPAVWHQQSGNWTVKQSSNGSGVTTNFGATAAFMTPGDFDGDSITDYAIFNNWTFAIHNSSTQADSYITLGVAGDRPVVGDYDGDGTSDGAVFRPSNGTWYIQKSTAGYTTFQFGAASDVLVPGDYDGDGKTDIAVFRPNDQLWYIQGSSAGFYSVSWGVGSDLPVPSDYDGDGKTDFAVWRPSTGTWYVLKSGSTGGAYIANAWGNYNDQPTPADYDGDGKTDFAVWRPKTGVWHIQKSSDGTYQPHTLGISTDKLVEAAYLKQNGSVAFDNTFARTRLAPRNAAGGTNLYSQNFGWGSGLVGLSGRNGLDAGFGIGYNSLVWIKHNNTMVFDPDYSDVAPGFRMGFPVIEPVYYDGTLQKYAYMMVSPSGARTEFRQTTASNVYETADSSYLQLTTYGASNPNDPSENITIALRGTDGTTMSYEFKGGAYRCNQIKDRNGNYISIVHDNYGLLQTVTDTLGRVISVNYDSDNSPTSITQQWNAGNGNGAAVTRTYATFVYTAKLINPSFDSSLTVFGPQGLQAKVLDKIVYGDTTNNTGETRFVYNNFGQVEKIGNHAKDGHQLNYTATNLNTPGTNLTDVPRLTETRSWVENFNGIGDIPAETVVTNSLQTGTQVTDIDGQTVSATVIQVQMQGHPNGSVTNSYVGASGWMEGLPIVANDFTNEGGGLQLRRSSWTKWTQDDENFSLIQNPRVKESKIGDNVSSRKTVIEYKMSGGNVSDHGLVSEVKLYDGSNNTLLKRSTTAYNQNAAYLSRGIIGLPSETNSYGLNQQTGTEQPISKVTYGYDEGNFNDAALQQTIAPIQHDSTNYGASFVIGRANPTSVTRHDVLNANTITSTLKYNTTGAVVSSIDPAGRQSKVIYADSFNDGNNNRNTFAYPTELIDAAGNFSLVKYRYDVGANVWAKSPAPAGNTSGKETTRIFDTLGRLQKQSVLKNGAEYAYTRYEYPTSQIQSKVFTTVVDTNNNGIGDAADEVLAESWTDGAGRTRMSRSPLTFSSGNTATWVGSRIEYDALGRVKRSTIPTEVDANFNPVGDDARLDGQGNVTFLWNSAEYDWKSRVVRTVDTDGNDTLTSYDGCGCAGGMTITVKGAEIIETDWDGTNPNNLGRRTQKIFQDVLGRTYKTQVMNWNGTTPYTTTVQKFNGGGQVLTSTKYAGTEASSTYQQTTVTYDGFGRMKTKHAPEQNAGVGTSYNYNADDGISSIVDGRGVTKTYTYTQLGLIGQVGYSVPNGSTIPVSQTSSYTYDNLGNRTQMTDGLGTVNYEYDELSRMTAEKRSFTDALANAPLANNGFRLEYNYTLAGQLKSYKDPYGQQFDSAYDRGGKLLSVTGAAAFAGVTNYASGAQYRAWGDLKKLDYGNSMTQETTYNNLLRPENFKLRKPDNSLKMDKDYSYYADGSLKKLDDAIDPVFDRMNKYDHIGRIKQGTAGVFARGETYTPGEQTAPYTKTYNYDVFDNLKGDVGGYWGYTANTYDYTFNTQGRVTAQTYNGDSIDPSKTWQYDADGRALRSYDELFNHGEQLYDAAGNLTKLTDYGYSTTKWSETYLIQDGNGLVGKKSQRYTTDNGATWTNNPTGYYITSSVFGGEVITEANATGKKLKTNIIAASREIAIQKITYDENGVITEQQVEWKNYDAFGVSDLRTRKKDGATAVTGMDFATMELDPVGLEVRSRQTINSGGGGTTIDPEIPILQNQPEPGAPGGDPDYHGAGGGGIGPLCDIGGPVAVLCNRVQIVDGFGRSGAFAMLERLAYLSSQPSGYRNHRRELVTNSDIYGDGRPPANARYGTGKFNEAYLLGYETWTTAIYSNWNFADFVGDLIGFKNFADAKSALEEAVKFGDCANQLQRLFSNLKRENDDYDNPVRSTDVVELLEKIAALSFGGVFFDKTYEEAHETFKQFYPNAKPDTIPRGLAFSISKVIDQRGLPVFGKPSNAYVYVFPQPLTLLNPTSNTPVSTTEKARRTSRVRGQLTLILIHELAHAAGKNSSFSHYEMDTAALLTDPSLSKFGFKNTAYADRKVNRARYFNQFLTEHCGLPQ